MVYQWKTGTRLPVKAEIAGEVCEKLEKEGRLTARDLVDESRSENAPLHKCFTWDDSKAAEKYREQEARHVINSLEIVIEEVEPVRGFFNLDITGTSTSQYESIEVILRNADKKETLLAQAYKELKAFEKKYQQLTELAEVFNAIDKIAV